MKDKIVNIPGSVSLGCLGLRLSSEVEVQASVDRLTRHLVVHEILLPGPLAGIGLGHDPRPLTLELITSLARSRG